MARTKKLRLGEATVTEVARNGERVAVRLLVETIDGGESEFVVHVAPADAMRWPVTKKLEVFAG